MPLPHNIITSFQNNHEFCSGQRYGYFEVIDHGTYYFPAWKHYTRPVIVICDRCQTNNLKACIGHKSKDLCMLCVEELTNGLQNK